MITIAINARIHVLDEPMTLTALLQEYLRIEDLEHLAVAHNGEVVTKDQYGQITVEDGDVLEIVQPVGGGA